MRRKVTAREGTALLLCLGLALAACAPSPKSTVAPTARPNVTYAPPQAGSYDPAAVLAAHNRLRAAHGVAPLAWSPRLAESAQRWAGQCRFEHSGPGENLVIWTGARPAADRVDTWYNEISDYDFATGQKTRAGAMTGHFTQIVWAETTQVGCGIRMCPGLGNYMVCQYDPPGNVQGQYTNNVSPAI